eukprot:gene8274-1543_t
MAHQAAAPKENMQSLVAAAATLSIPVYALVVLVGVLSANRLTVLYTWHPVLEVVFYITALMGIIKPQMRAFTNPSEHKALMAQHAYWQIAAAVAVSAGTAAIYINKEQKGYPHLTSWHGVVGYTATFWWLFQVVAGIMIYKFPRKLGGNLKKMYYAHRVSGYLSLIAVGLAHFLAAVNGYNGHELGSRAAMVIIIALLTSLFLVLANGRWTSKLGIMKID